MIKRTILLGNPCRLALRLDQLLIQYNHITGQEDMADRTVPIEDLGVIILEHEQITLTHPVMNKLVEYNVGLVCCNERKLPTGLLLNLDGNSVQQERFEAQINASEPLRKQLWQQTVKAKILNQASLLKQLQRDTTYLLELARQVRSGDADNCEAKAASYYWQRLFSPSWNFVRHREGPPPNNLLNYGYAILRALTARALIGSGLLPTLGIFHRNRYNAYCLADDIMEPYRPFVDAVVAGILSKTSHIHELNNELKVPLLKIPQLDVMIDGKKSPLMVAMSRTTASLANCYLGHARKIIYPEL
ncbi:MAG: type II CRISPR-associated endonuclease Cas1 [Chitinophagales bacterium]|nr:type II CRISPR-associated endonuclease Cas1 [Chitinophagales bacterium]